MMGKNILKIISIMLLLSCGSKKILTKYYTIEPGPIEQKVNEAVEQNTPLPYTVYIQKFEAAKPFDDNTIVQRSASNEIQYYVYHKWAEKPGNALRRFIWQYLNDSKVFRSCEINLYQQAPDLEISGYLFRLERIMLDDQEKAHLKIRLQLKKSENLEVLAEHDVDRFLPMGDPADMNRFADIISITLKQELDLFIEKIWIHFKS